MVYVCQIFVHNKKSALAVARKLDHLGRVSTGYRMPGVGLFTRIIVETEMAKMVVEQHFKKKMDWTVHEKFEDLESKK